MKHEEIKEVLRLHQMWLNNEDGGVRADLRGANLIGANLIGADLRRADLECANLSGANLGGADLRDADLTGVNLRGAYLGGADLRRAYLGGADLRDADLTGVDLIGADLECAKNYYSFIALDTSKRIVHCVKDEGGWMVKAGCFWGTLDELEAKVKNTHNSKVYLANIEILRGIK
jgi:hypothetical protein